MGRQTRKICGVDDDDLGILCLRIFQKKRESRARDGRSAIFYGGEGHEGLTRDLEFWVLGVGMAHHSTSHLDKKQDLCLPDGRTEADTLL